MDKATAEKKILELVDSVESLTKKEMGPGEAFKSGEEFKQEPDTTAEKRRYYAALSGLRCFIEALTHPPVLQESLTTVQIIDGLQALGPMEDQPPVEATPSKPADFLHDESICRHCKKPRTDHWSGQYLCEGSQGENSFNPAIEAMGTEKPKAKPKGRSEV